MKIRSIQVQLISMILLILFFSVALSILFTTGNQKNNLIDASQQTLAVNTQVLNHTIRNIMLNGEAPLANQTMADLREMPEFLEYEIYRRDGSLAFSNYETLEFVNQYQDRVDFERTPRLMGDMLENPDFQEVLRFKTPQVILDEEAREMQYYFPILNYADCRACHGDDHFIRGISHFRISLSDVYEKVQSTQWILTFFFMTVGFFIFLGVWILSRRIVLKPIKIIGEAVGDVGQGDLDIEITLDREDEMGALATRINKMIQGLKASKLLELENTRVEARLQESRKYLDNIQEGLLLLDRDYIISEEYSFYLKDLFEKKQISGIPLWDFLYETPTEEQIQEIQLFLQILFENTTASMDMINDINPLDQLTLKLNSGKEIIIHGDFQRIYEDEKVQNVMILFQDRTDVIRSQEALEEEKQKRESELEQIASILKLGPQVFQEFVESADQLIRFIEENKSKLYQKDLLAQAFRDTHSLKGTARYLQFHHLEKTAHQMEDHFGQFQSTGAALEDIFTPEMEKQLLHMIEEIALVKKIIHRFRQFAPESSSSQPNMDIFQQRLEEMIQELAEELDKEVNFLYKSELQTIPGLKKIQPAIFHLVKNSLDHGIEDPFERIAKRKEKQGQLILSIRKEKNNLIVEVSDDGAGLDFAAIEKRGLETGLLKPGKHFPSQILNVMFMSGFSSRDEVSSISGRGVGLDAVKTDVQKLGGKINVKTTKDSGTRFILTLPLNKLEENR